jgi:hypothetical protein
MIFAHSRTGIRLDTPSDLFVPRKISSPLKFLLELKSSPVLDARAVDNFSGAPLE